VTVQYQDATSVTDITAALESAAMADPTFPVADKRAPVICCFAWKGGQPLDIAQVSQTIRGFRSEPSVLCEIHFIGERA
jgi:hypothetical protein